MAHCCDWEIISADLALMYLIFMNLLIWHRFCLIWVAPEDAGDIKETGKES
jgi:hypothetical protein